MRFPVTAAILFSGLAFTASLAGAAEIRVFATGAVQHSVQEIVAAFEKDTGHKIIATFGTAGAIGKRLEAGEAADVVLSSSGGLRDAKAKLAEGEPVLVGRVRMGMAVKEGAAKPDISTPEKFKAVLLSVASFAYGDPAQGSTTGVHFGKTLEQMGIAEQVKAKSVLGKDGFDVTKSVVDGKAVIGFTQTTEIQMVKGAEVAGLMPDAYQLVSSYAMALTKEGEKSEAAKALYARIASPKGVEAFAHHGFEVKK
jgi:molybdate transport system substrate-binding protein